MRIAVLVSLLSVAMSASSHQPAPDPVRAGITVMRAMNTAQNAARQSTGRYLELVDLLNHPAMSRVRGEIVVNGGAVTHQGQQLRLALSPDAMQYLVTVVPTDTCGTAVFSNEGGLIYTGKVLDCK